MDLNVIRSLAKPSDTKIALLVMDGLGGLPVETGGKTELESARTPNLDVLAGESATGLHQVVGAGITPGSGPGHLSLFGYDPLKYQVGRGVLAALGVDFDLRPGDLAARGNFCTLDDAGRVTDRRAGRISTEKNRELCAILQQIEIPGVQVFVETVKEHRLLFVLRGEDLHDQITDTDPQSTGCKPLEPRALAREAEPTIHHVSRFLEEAKKKLADQHPANMLLLRGFAQRPDWPTFPEVFNLKAAAIAGYPMYRGVAKLLGMEALSTGSEVEEEFETLEKSWADYDFFYLHVKRIDSKGEDGDFDGKVALIEEVDAQLPRLLELDPDVVVVTGDHSTPAAMKYHSWHPVPVLMWSRHCRPDSVQEFGERACLAGSLGPRFPGPDLMPLAMGNALRLEKFGA